MPSHMKLAKQDTHLGLAPVSSQQDKHSPSVQWAAPRLPAAAHVGKESCNPAIPLATTRARDQPDWLLATTAQHVHRFANPTSRQTKPAGGGKLGP